MTLPSDLVSQFAKLTKKDNNSKTEAIVYGTIVEYNNAKYVKLDGSDLLTPISSVTNMEPGERVTVMIKNHSATVTGNISSPSARTAEVEEIAGQFSRLVTGANGESLMTQTDTGWSFSMADIQSQLKDTSQNVSDLEQSVSDLGVYTEYIKFGTHNGQPCIILGETDSEFKLNITNTDIRFLEGSAVLVTISNQAWNAGTAVVNGELRQGGFAWIARSNGNYGLVWKGE